MRRAVREDDVYMAGRKLQTRESVSPNWHRLPLLELLQNHGPQLRDAACAQGQDHVAVLRGGCGGIRGFGERTHVMNASAAVLADSFADPRGQRFGGNTFDRLFAGGINIQHKQRIGVAEGGSEFFHQVARARVAMRLEYDVNLAEAALLRRRQRGFDLGWMMAIIVDHAHTRSTPAKLEAPVYAAELIERRADRLNSNIQ